MTKQDGMGYTEEEAHGNRFQDVETESAKRMIRCNPSQTAVATPTPNFGTQMEQSFTNFLDMRYLSAKLNV